MSKKILIAAGAGVLGYIIYQKYFSPAARSGNLVSQYSDPKYRNQPAMQYPVRPDQPARVDNQSEPWAPKNRNFLSNPSGNVSQVQVLAQNLQAVGSISESISDIWDNLDIGSWFSSGGNDFIADAESKGSDPLTDEAFDMGWMNA